MTNKQIDQLEMLGATETVLNAQAALWGSVPKITEAKTALSQAILAVKATAQKQESAQVAVAKDLRAIKKEVASKMDTLDDILEAYAEDTEDVELQQQANNSMTDYFRLSHEEFEIKVKNVIALAEPRMTDMADYGLAPEQLEEVKTAFGAFEDLRGKPRSYQIASKVATSNLETQLEEAMNQAVRLDKLLKRFRRSQPDFYSAYSAARMIVRR